jgi:hypothetical protein
VWIPCIKETMMMMMMMMIMMMMINCKTKQVQRPRGYRK